MIDQKRAVNKVMRLTGARNFAQLERQLGCASGGVSRIFHNHRGISHSFFCKVLLATGMTAVDLCNELGIPMDYFEGGK